MPKRWLIVVRLFRLLGVLQRLGNEEFGQGLSTELGYVLGVGVDLTGSDGGTQTMRYRQRSELFE